MTTSTLVLFGDSILDNAPYTRPAPDSTAHLQRLLNGWRVERLAQDGAKLASIQFQLGQLKSRASVAVLSVGGNDALEHLGLLTHASTSSGALLGQLLGIADDFEHKYASVVRAVAAEADRAVLCTIYEAPLEPAPYARVARVPLAVLNDRIIRTASRLGVDVLDLRSVCTDPADFVLQIEPSAQGAKKIAQAIASVVSGGAGLTSAHVFSAGTQQADG